jgi:hypothetical protein
MTGPNGTKLGRKHLYKFLYKVSPFCSIPPTNMATKGNSCFRCFLPSLAPFAQAVSEEKIFLTLTNQKKELILVAMFVGQMEPNEEAL